MAFNYDAQKPDNQKAEGDAANGDGDQDEAFTPSLNFPIPPGIELVTEIHISFICIKKCK